MPYIPNTDRDFLDLTAHGTRVKTAGELNFAITTLLLGFLGKSFRYQDLNDVMGALEGAKMEFYRRKVAGYEDDCIVKNGDVF
jgi:hypothetical protein